MYAVVSLIPSLIHSSYPEMYKLWNFLILLDTKGCGYFY